MIIGLCGATGAGKDAAARHISGRWNGAPFKHSSLLREKLRLNGVPEVPANMSALFEANASVLGYAWLAREVLWRIKAHLAMSLHGVGPEAERTGPVVINGIRNLEEIALYRTEFAHHDFRLVAIIAPRELRYERVRNRGERDNEHDMSWEDFAAIENLEAHTGEDAVIEQADLEIYNEGTLEAFHDSLREFLRLGR